MRAFVVLMALEVCLAAAATAQIRPPRATPEGIRDQIVALSAADPIARAFAACYLGAMGRRAEEAVPALARALADATPTDPVECRGTSYGGPFTFLTGVKSSPGLEAARALGAIRSDTAIAPVLQAVRSANRDLRRNAARALGLLHDARSVDALIVASRDADALVRAEAAAGLGRQRDPRGVDALLILVRDNEPAIRAEAARALGRVQRSR